MKLEYTQEKWNWIRYESFAWRKFSSFLGGDGDSGSGGGDGDVRCFPGYIQQPINEIKTMWLKCFTSSQKVWNIGTGTIQENLWILQINKIVLHSMQWIFVYTEDNLSERTTPNTKKTTKINWILLFSWMLLMFNKKKAHSTKCICIENETKLWWTFSTYAAPYLHSMRHLMIFFYSLELNYSMGKSLAVGETKKMQIQNMWVA